MSLIPRVRAGVVESISSTELSQYYFHDPRAVLIPIEHLSPAGMSAAFADLLRERADWSAERIALFNQGVVRYWQRVSRLASMPGWAPPRLRHVAVLRAPFAVHPYSQLLNTSAWLLYEDDLDPQKSHAEFVAYLLVHGDRMAVTGEVTRAAVLNAAYWFDRTSGECAAFSSAAAASARPDAEAFRRLADALPWLRELYHETLRPPPAEAAVRAIPRSGLLVPQRLEAEPPRLIEQWAESARAAVAEFRKCWSGVDHRVVAAICDWLAGSAPRLLITGKAGRILWDYEHPEQVGALRSELRLGTAAALRDVHEDLRSVDRHTRAFLNSLTWPERLPRRALGAEQRGYVYLHSQRGVIAYNVHEPGIERLQSPALPYARAMLGARTVHEWAHQAVDAGWVPQRIGENEMAQRVYTLAALLGETVANCPVAVREQASEDLANLCRGREPGKVLAERLLGRIPDYRANILAQRYLDLAERETYVRQNIRTLREEYSAHQRWRMLVRYLYEYQYLRFSAVADPREYFLRSTWFDADFIATGILDEARFDALAAAVERICSAYCVDESAFAGTS